MTTRSRAFPPAAPRGGHPWAHPAHHPGARLPSLLPEPPLATDYPTTANASLSPQAGHRSCAGTVNCEHYTHGSVATRPLAPASAHSHTSWQTQSNPQAPPQWCTAGAWLRPCSGGDPSAPRNLPRIRSPSSSQSKRRLTFLHSKWTTIPTTLGLAGRPWKTFLKPTWRAVLSLKQTPRQARHISPVSVRES